MNRSFECKYITDNSVKNQRKQTYDYRKRKTYTQDNNFSVIRTHVRSLNLECVRPERAGVIIITVRNDAMWIGVGLDAKTHDLTDFGGHVMTSDKNVIEGALREFDEETLMIFDHLSCEEIAECPVIYDDKNLIIFIHMDVNPNEISQIFLSEYESVMRKKPKKCQRPEVCQIVWLSWEDFQAGLHRDGIIFSRVQRFLRRAGDFSCLL